MLSTFRSYVPDMKNVILKTRYMKVKITSLFKSINAELKTQYSFGKITYMTKKNA
jgi:hypothetical protein